MKTLKTIIFGGIVASSVFLQAGELTPDEGLQRLSQNVETCTKNRDEINRAIAQINENVTTLESANLDLQNKKKRLHQQIDENKNTLALHNKKLQDLERNRIEEDKKLKDDAAKMVQLEKTLAQLKEIYKMRNDRVLKLESDRNSIIESQKQGEGLQVTLDNEIKNIDQRIESLTKEVAPWKERQKSYQKEASRWNGELERHQKMEAEVKLLLDSTT
ncbi:MAG: hypothetical protein RJB66_348 [Pseudomonadota bacterium]|jgi:chromosome segregation ATPase